MKKILLFICFLTVMAGYSQIDSGTKSMAIPLSKKRKSPPSVAIAKPEPAPPVKENPAPTPKPQVVEKEKEITMIPKDEFIEPGRIIEDKLNKRTEGNQFREVRRNEHLGNYHTSSAYIMVKYRDYGDIDGDRVELRNNDALILENDYLEASFKEYRVDLVHGINKIEIKALNDGLLYPNTAEYRITDEKGEHISSKTWALAAGFKAVLIIIRE
ncbi:MAG TPA: hypothetical protein VF676_12620 [Flavobacterium sp.]|jgi:hypothetical protein